jgi:hypothetical protein
MCSCLQNFSEITECGAVASTASCTLSVASVELIYRLFNIARCTIIFRIVCCDLYDKISG